MPFKALGLAPYLIKTIAKQGYKKPTPIQEKAIPLVLEGKDLLGIAPTGSGKTAAYVLPIIQMLKGKTKTKNRHLNVLVLVPTRELAIQVEAVFQQFSAGLPFLFKSLAVYGGVSINPQMIGMQHVNVLVATPGRLLDLHASNAMHFNALTILVLDEADKMLNMGFKKEMEQLFALLPDQRQNLLFSATLSQEVQHINSVLLHDPSIIQIEAKKESIDLIQQTAYLVSPEKKGPLLRQLIQNNKWEQVLVFTSSVHRADQVAHKLRKNDIDAESIHSKVSQASRRENLANFKAGKLRVLVATDLLGRGIDIAFLPHVINYELPRSPKDFIHRIGRTGRAKHPGDAISFVAEEDKHHFKVIQKKMKSWVKLINADEIIFAQ